MDIFVSDVSTFEGESPNAKLGLEPFLSRQAIDMSGPALTSSSVAYVKLGLIFRRTFSDYQGRGIFLIGRRPLTFGYSVQWILLIVCPNIRNGRDLV